jgi:hypothetical protein
MATNLAISADAKEESNQQWARWIAKGARRDRDRQKRVIGVAIVVAIVFAVWVARILVLG